MNTQQLSPQKYRFVELMQQIGFGRIEDLTVQSGEPVIDPPPRIVREFKFGARSKPRSKSPSREFALKSEVIELFATLAKLRNGEVETLEIRHGLPFRLVVADLHDDPGDNLMVAFARYPMQSLDVDRATTIAKVEASRRVRLGHFATTDRDDVIQDLLVGVVGRWPRYDSDRAKFATFFSIIVRREASSLARVRRAAKRGGGLAPFSLDERIADSKVSHRHTPIDSDAIRFDLRHDVQAVVAGLTPDLQRLARAIMSQSPAAAARSLRLSRRAATAQMIAIRERFIEAGLAP